MADIKAIKGTDGTTYNLRDDYSKWGGENLLLNTNFKQQYSQTTGWNTTKNGTLLASNWGGYNSGVTNPGSVYHAHLKLLNDEYIYEYIKTADEYWLGISQGGLQSKLVAGQRYIFSWEQYCVSNTNNYLNGGLYYYKTGASSANFHLGSFYGSTGRVADKWQKFTYSFTAPTDGDYAKNMSWYIYGHNGNGTVYLRRPKLELGDKATDWSPCYKDIFSYSNEQLIVNL